MCFRHWKRCRSRIGVMGPVCENWGGVLDFGGDCQYSGLMAGGGFEADVS